MERQSTVARSREDTSDNHSEAKETEEVQRLRKRIKLLEAENERLRASQQTEPAASVKESSVVGKKCSGEEVGGSYSQHNLTREAIERYSRQLLLRGGFGVEGQQKLLSSAVLVVGAGGIGSTVILYLAACGIGKLTIVDFDDVEVSNLHRQVIHKSLDVGMNKADSACKAVKDLNPSINCVTIKEPFTARNSLSLVADHDCVVDACDNPQTRYLVNDACVIANKPLISGSAMGTEGQLTVYNYMGGPCYRCLYPKPNPTEGYKTCADNGVLGPVPGMIGILQAMEVLKVITGTGVVVHDRLVMYDSLSCSFLRIKKPPKQASCQVCGSRATIKNMDDSHEKTLGARGPSCQMNRMSDSKSDASDGEKSLPAISCSEYAKLRKSGTPHVLLDVRAREQFDLCTLSGATNIPLEILRDNLGDVERLSKGTKPVYCLCRRGIASVAATKILNDAAADHPNIHSATDISGGLDSWRRDVDHQFPKY